MGINKAILVGRLGKDPELRYTPSGAAVANFSLATSERYTDRDGQRQERTEWHNIVVWSKLAELANQYLKKGKLVYIEGRITSRTWDDRDGNKRYRTEIVAANLEFLDGGSGGESRGTPGGAAAASASHVDETPLQTEPVEPGGGEEDLPF